jgi:(p)ppGpp synthase/HD superfamily hydrolase
MAIQKYTTLPDCIALAEFAHRNQTDKAGLPYIEHPRRVMEAVQTQGALPYVQMAAILHDVTEDTAFTPYTLLELGIPEAAVEIVKLLDRGHSELIFHMEYLEDETDKDTFYYESIRKNPEAVKVKLADIGDNLQPWRLAYLPEETQERLREKYAKAIKLLTE